MKILVTGSAGFIGFFLTESLLKRGDEVVGIDNINDYYSQSLKYSRLQHSGIEKSLIQWGSKVTSSKFPSYKFVRMNLEDKESLVQLFNEEKFDVIVHLAAQAGVRYSIENPDAYVQSNIVGFLNILEMSRHFSIKHLVYASSSSVYGKNSKMPFSVKDSVNHPVSLYAASKKANELMAHTYSHLYGIPTSGLRFFTVYGPWGRPDMAYFLFAEAIRSNRPIKVFNQGKMKRDFTYIDDIVNGVINVLDHPSHPDQDWNADDPDPSTSSAPYRIFNIGNNKPVELMKFINTLGKAMGKTPEMILMDMQPGDVQATWANVDELIKDFDYSPSTSIETGLGNFVEWYSTYYDNLQYER